MVVSSAITAFYLMCCTLEGHLTANLLGYTAFDTYLQTSVSTWGDSGAS